MSFLGPTPEEKRPWMETSHPLWSLDHQLTYSQRLAPCGLACAELQLDGMAQGCLGALRGGCPPPEAKAATGAEQNHSRVLQFCYRDDPEMIH